MSGPFAYTKTRDDTPTIIRWARLLLTLALVPIGLNAFRDFFGWVPLVADMDLAIHEFGHALFRPFGIPILGRTAVILGGSLFQCVLPLIFMGYFLFAKGGKRDVHAAMVCLWWASMNLLNVSIYCGDSRAGQLTLLDGGDANTSDGHDWRNLLNTWHALNKDLVIAGYMRDVAWLLFGVSIVVGLVAAWRSGREPNEVMT